MQQKTETEESDVVLFNVSGDCHVHMFPYFSLPCTRQQQCVLVCVVHLLLLLFVDSDKGIPGFDGVLEIDEVRSACICRWLHVM